MAPTLLLDLDNTLLQNNMEDFLPAYFQAVSGYFSSEAEPSTFIEALIGGTRAMIANQNPGLTLERVFDRHFYPAIGIAKEETAGRLKEFYANVFPDLVQTTQVWPAAKSLVEDALSRGARLAITTNPVFPRAAILERLTWAGVPANIFPFELISSYEYFHFAKPNPAFFAEVMARLGWPDGPVVVVGNDPKNDIEAAQNLGLATFQICTDGKQPSFQKRHACGSLQEILPWIDSAAPEQLQPEPSAPSALMAVLRSTPAALKTIFNQWAYPPTSSPSPTDWSLTEIICHLRDVEREVNLPRIRRVLAEENPHLTGEDTDSWALERNYLAQECLPAIEAFVAARREALELLESAGPTVWDRKARHTIFGPTNLLELIGISTGHDRVHFQQIHELRMTISAD